MPDFGKEEPGRLTLGDDDPELARFFAGEPMSADPVEDGGKGLTFLDAEPDPNVPVVTNEEFWSAAREAQEAGM